MTMSINDYDCDGYRPIHHAVLARDLVRVDQLLGLGALLNLPTEAGEGVLNLAVRLLDDAEAAAWCRELLDRGAEVIDRDLAGMTPLHLAVQGRKLKTMQTLIEAGADPHFKNRAGQKPTDLAQNDPTLLQVLLPKRMQNP